MFFSHRTSFKINFMGIVDKPVKDAIGDSRITNDVMPVFYGQLAGNDGWSMPVSFIYNFKEISSFGISQGRNAEVVNDQDMGFGEFIHDFSITAVIPGKSHLIIETGAAR